MVLNGESYEINLFSWALKYLKSYKKILACYCAKFNISFRNYSCFDWNCNRSLAFIFVKDWRNLLYFIWRMPVNWFEMFFYHDNSRLIFHIMHPITETMRYANCNIKLTTFTEYSPCVHLCTSKLLPHL